MSEVDKLKPKGASPIKPLRWSPEDEELEAKARAVMPGGAKATFAGLVRWALAFAVDAHAEGAPKKKARRA